MKFRVKSSFLTVVIVAALAFSAGCGDNDNNNNDNGGGGPTRTPTPVVSPTGVVPTETPSGPTATPTAGPGENLEVQFTFNATAAIQGFQVTVANDPANGSFVGSADAVECSGNTGGIFTKNNTGATLILSVANTSDLTLPIVITCNYTATAIVDGSDFPITTNEVTQNGSVGDPTVLQPSAEVLD